MRVHGVTSRDSLLHHMHTFLHTRNATKVFRFYLIIGLSCDKTTLLVSDQVRHKLVCTATENGKNKKLEILHLGSRRVVLSV